MSGCRASGDRAIHAAKPHGSLRLAAIVLLVVAALVRLAGLDLMLFHFDEGIASIYAVQLVHRGIVPLYGVKTSLHFHNPPLFIFLVALPYALSWSPVVATGFLQLFQLGALAWLWRIMRRAGWSAAALAVLAVAALSPGPLLLAQRLWGHALIAPLSIATFALAWRMRSRPRDPTAAILLPLSVSIAQQVHFSGILLVVSAGAGLWYLRARVNWRWLAGGITLAMATYTPYLIHLVQTGLADVRTVFSLVAHGSGGDAHHAPLWLAALHSLSDFGANAAARQNYAHFIAGITGFVAVQWALAIAFVAACGRALVVWIVMPRFRTATEPPPDGELLARLGLIWMAVPMFVFGVLRVETVPAYWLVALPGPWLVAGAAIAGLLGESAAGAAARPRPMTRSVVTGACLGIVSGFFVLYLVHHATSLAQGDEKSVVLPSYRDQVGAVRTICDTSRGRHALVSQDNRTLRAGVDYQYLFLIAMLEGNAERFSPDNIDSATARFLIHNRANPLPTGFEQQLRAWQRSRFGLLDVYTSGPATGIAN